MLFCLGRLSGLALFAGDVLFFWRILSFLRVGVAGLLGSLCTLLGSPPLSHGSVLGGCASCRWDTFEMYHHPYSWCERWSCGNRCWGMRIGKVSCSIVLRSALSGSVSRWVARATWALSCHPRTCIRNSRWPPSSVDLGSGFRRF